MSRTKKKARKSNSKKKTAPFRGAAKPPKALPKALQTTVLPTVSTPAEETGLMTDSVQSVEPLMNNLQLSTKLKCIRSNHTIKGGVNQNVELTANEVINKN